ncbi:hypothetical protein GBAR_LOCUS19120, partial [Geodia barretti]
MLNFVKVVCTAGNVTSKVNNNSIYIHLPALGWEVLGFGVAAVAPDPESGEVCGGGREGGGTLHGWGCCSNTSRATSSRATVLFLSAMATWVQVQSPVPPYLLSHSMMTLRSLSSLFL